MQVTHPMASTMLALARTHRASSVLRHVTSQARLTRGLDARRTLHRTPVVLKRSSKKNIDDDLFADSGDTLFSSSEANIDSVTDGKEPSAKPTTAAKAVAQPKDTGKLSPEERLARFNTLYQLLSDRIGKNPPAKARRDPQQVRKTAWQHLFGLATTEEQLERVTELFPKWRDSQQVFTPLMTEAFIRRCEELRCPTLALKVFSDHPKYGMNLTHLPAARQLLHSLHLMYPLDKTVTLAALYSVYRLPAISSDLVSCALFTAACLKAQTPPALAIAKALIPELKKLLRKTSPKTMALAATKHAKNIKGGKEKTWLKWTLLKVEKSLAQRKEPVDWLRKWRAASLPRVHYIPAATA